MTVFKNKKMEVAKQDKRHYFSLSNQAQEVTISYNGKELAKSRNAILLKEVGKEVYDQVYYIPRSDVNMVLFEKNTNSSVCPIKGEASYYDLLIEGNKVENVAWSYEEPLPRAKRITEYLAFYPNLVSFLLKPD